MAIASLKDMFDDLSSLLRAHGKGLVITERLENSNGTGNKPQLHLLGKKSVAIGRRKAQPTYIAGLILQKHFVGFYSMPLYSHPQDLSIAHPDVAKMRKGKSCINVNTLTPAIRKELDRLLKVGIRTYKKEGWI